MLFRSVFPQLENASIGEIFSLKTGFPDDDRSSFYNGEEVMKNVCPRLVWFSLPADSDYAVMSQFAKIIVEHQLSHSNFFIIAHPWNSSFWNNKLILETIARHDLSYYSIDLSVFDTSLRNCDSLCLLCNLPKGSLDPMSTKVNPMKAISKFDEFSDNYPIGFCENILTLAADAIRSCKGTSGDSPVSSPYYLSFMNDVLDVLDFVERRCCFFSFLFTGTPLIAYDVVAASFLAPF